MTAGKKNHCRAEKKFGSVPFSTEYNKIKQKKASSSQEIQYATD